jgi:biopolymer transport protein ExbB
MMWVILGFLAAALAIIIERLVFFFRTANENADGLAVKTAQLVTDNEMSTALETLDEKGGPVQRLMRRAVEVAWAGGEAIEIQQGVEELAMREIPSYGRRLNYLAMLANVATLAGLLGTIFGLQQSFSSLAVAEAAQKSSVLASGISQAMNTTAFGLMVAMPLLAVHAGLASLATGRTEECDAAVVKLLNFFNARDRLRRSSQSRSSQSRSSQRRSVA